MGNEVYINGQDNTDADFEISVFNPVRGPIIITKNYIHDCVQGCIQIAITGSNSEISYNIIDGFGTSVYTGGPTSGKFVAIRLGSHQMGVNNVQNVKVYNNVIINGGTASGSGAITIAVDGMEGASIKNNIFYNNSCQDIKIIKNPVGVFDIDNNLYHHTEATGGWNWNYRKYDALLDLQTASVEDYNSFDADALFIGSDNYHLRADSPAIDAGADVGLNYDYDGNVVPYGINPDIGVYEHGY